MPLDTSKHPPPSMCSPPDLLFRIPCRSFVYPDGGKKPRVRSHPVTTPDPYQLTYLFVSNSQKNQNLQLNGRRTKTSEIPHHTSPESSSSHRHTASSAQWCCVVAAR